MTQCVPATGKFIDRTKQFVLWLFPAMVIVISSAARAHVDRELSIAFSSAGLSSEWISMFADLTAAVSFLSAVFAWLMIVTLAHLMAVLLDGDGRFDYTLRDAGYAFIPIAAASLFTALSIDTIIAQSAGAYGTLNGLNSDQLRIALASSQRLTLTHALNNASEFIGLLFVCFVIYERHKISALKCLVSVFLPIVLVYLVKRVVIVIG